jgi:hypothetical protein
MKTITKQFSNPQDCVTAVVMFSGNLRDRYPFSVQLHDDDAMQYVPYVNFFPNEKEANTYAEFIANNLESEN